MSNFMSTDIIRHLFRGKNQTPGVGDIAICATTAPTASRVTQGKFGRWTLLIDQHKALYAALKIVWQFDEEIFETKCSNFSHGA